MKRAALLVSAIAWWGGLWKRQGGAQDGEGGPELAPSAPQARRGRSTPAPAMTSTASSACSTPRTSRPRCKEHFDDIRGCYRRAGKAQRYADGRVLLRFLVNGDGVVAGRAGHRVDAGQLRRRALPGRGRPPDRLPRAERPQADDVRVPGRVPFDQPGARCWTSTASRSSTTSRSFLPQLAACGQLATEDANAIIYIEPNGVPGLGRAGGGGRARRGRRRLHGADDPRLEDVGDAPRPRHARDVQHPARHRHRRSDAHAPAHRRRRSREQAIA